MKLMSANLRGASAGLKLASANVKLVSADLKLASAGIKLVSADLRMLSAGIGLGLGGLPESADFVRAKMVWWRRIWGFVGML